MPFSPDPISISPRAWSEVSLREQAIAGVAGGAGGLAGSGATVVNQLARNSAKIINATMQRNLSSYSGTLIAEGANDVIIRQVQNAVTSGMARDGYSTATMTSVVSAIEALAFPFAEEALEESMKSSLPNSFSFGGSKRGNTRK